MQLSEGTHTFENGHARELPSLRAASTSDTSNTVRPFLATLDEARAMRYRALLSASETPRCIAGDFRRSRCINTAELSTAFFHKTFTILSSYWVQSVMHASSPITRLRRSLNLSVSNMIDILTTQPPAFVLSTSINTRIVTIGLSKEASTRNHVIGAQHRSIRKAHDIHVWTARLSLLKRCTSLTSVPRNSIARHST
jgi:hypothetical protein